MKVSHILIASALLAAGPAIAQETAAPEGSGGLVRHSRHSLTRPQHPLRPLEHVSAAKAVRDGEREALL